MKAGRTSATARAARALEVSGLGSLLRRLDTWRGILVFAYHRIGDPAGSALFHDMWTVSTADFERQVAVLAREADVISGDDLDRVVRRRRGRHVMITFDDGYRDAYEEAYPVLQRHGLSATFFLTTGFLDRRRPAWWDRIAWMAQASVRPTLVLSGWLPRPLSLDASAKDATIRTLVNRYASLPGDRTRAYLEAVGEATGSGQFPVDLADEAWMTWDMAREMRDGGMTFGNHTVGHPVLARHPMPRQAREIAEAGRRIQEELGGPAKLFSYPVGGRDAFDRRTRAALASAGVRYAFSCYGGVARFDSWDSYDIRRASPPQSAREDRLRSAVTLPQAFARN